MSLGIAPRPQETPLLGVAKFSSPQVQKRSNRSNRMITAKFNSSSFDAGDVTMASSEAGHSRPPTAGRSRPPTAGHSRPTTAGRSRPTTSGSVPNTNSTSNDHHYESLSHALDRPNSGIRPLTGSRPQSSRRSIASKKGILFRGYLFCLKSE